MSFERTIIVFALKQVEGRRSYEYFVFSGWWWRVCNGIKRISWSTNDVKKEKPFFVCYFSNSITISLSINNGHPSTNSDTYVPCICSRCPDQGKITFSCLQNRTKHFQRFSCVIFDSKRKRLDDIVDKCFLLITVRINLSFSVNIIFWCMHFGFQVVIRSRRATTMDNVQAIYNRFTRTSRGKVRLSQDDI